MDEIAPMIGVIGMFVAIGYIVRWVSDNRRDLKLARMHFDAHNKLVDKFSSSQELLEYVASDAGRQLLRWSPAQPTNPYAKILTSIQWGLVLLAGGVAFLFLRGQIADAFEGLSVLGTLGVALGFGFLVSAAVAYFLSKSWGVLKGHDGPLAEQR